MDFCIFYGNFFQNWFPGFAHILHVEFLTVLNLGTGDLERHGVLDVARAFRRVLSDFNCHGSPSPQRGARPAPRACSLRRVAADADRLNLAG